MPEDKIENKMFHARILAHKTVDTDEGLVIEGFASTPTVDRDGESIDPMAFAESARTFVDKGVICLYHDTRQPVGRPLAVKLDPEAGFWIKAILSKAPDVASTVIKVREKILKAFSVGFRPMEHEDKDGVRVWKKLDLYEVSLVAAPANMDCFFSVGKGLKYGSDLAIPETLFESELRDRKFVTREELEEAMRTKDASGNTREAEHAANPPDEHDKFIKTLADVERELAEESKSAAYRRDIQDIVSWKGKE